MSEVALGVRGLGAGASVAWPETTFRFNRHRAAMAPGMAVRPGPGGVWSGAVMAQGKWDGSGTPDLLSVPRGDLVSGLFYSQFDPYQGGGFCEWTPEQGSTDRLDGLDAYIWYISLSYYLRYEYDNNRYALYIGGQSTTIPATITAGTPEYLAWGFDTNNSVDASGNYAYFSRNNTQTYGATVQPTTMAPGAVIQVGSRGDSRVANGSIAGLHFMRRVPFTGVYGTDVGNGDEVAAHYNDGNGADPAIVTKGIDMVMGVPTNATPGELVTGEGHAWATPWADNYWADWHMMTEYLSSAWDDVASVVTPYSVAFNGTTTIINCGSDASLDNLADAAMTVGAWVRADSFGEGGTAGRIIDKTDGWAIWVANDGTLHATVRCATTNAHSATAINIVDGDQHYVEITFDDGGDRKTYISVDGVMAVSYTIQDAAVGLVTDDSDGDVIIGNNSVSGRTWEGAISWVGIADAVNHVADFDPPSRMNPGIMTNRVEQWNFRDGTGTALAAEVSAANDGAISNGAWDTVKDMRVDNPGGRMYEGGCAFGGAAGDGIEQIITGLTNGQSMVSDVVLHNFEDVELEIYDITNTAVVKTFTVPGGGTRAAPSVVKITWDGYYTGGAFANYTSLRMRILCTTDQDIYVHMAGAYPNLVVNPSMEAWQGTDPDIPTGWANAGLDSGDIEPSSGGGAIIHSGSEAAQWNVGAITGEAIYQNLVAALAEGDFFSFGGWLYGDGTRGLRLAAAASSHATLQYSDTIIQMSIEIAASWAHSAAVFRRGAGVACNMQIAAQSTAVGNRYADDLYVVKRDAVVLTAVPASYINSLELGGVRIDGFDSLPQPVTNLTATKGEIVFSMVFRHGPADFMTFAEGSAVYYFASRYDATNQILLYSGAADTINLYFEIADVETEAQWAVIGAAIVPGVRYQFRCRYSADGIFLEMDGVERASDEIVVPDFGANVPTDHYWGSTYVGRQQADVVIGEPRFIAAYRVGLLEGGSVLYRETWMSYSDLVAALVDPNIGVVWASRPPDSMGPEVRQYDTVPDGTEFTGLRDWLKDNGMSTPQVNAAINHTVDGRTRLQIWLELLAWLVANT